MLGNRLGWQRQMGGQTIAGGDGDLWLRETAEQVKWGWMGGGGVVGGGGGRGRHGGERQGGRGWR